MMRMVEEGIKQHPWLESAEADMAENGIDREDVHDRNKWRMLRRKPFGV